MRPSSRTLYIAAIAGIILYVLLDTIAQLLPPHYSPISQAESDLAVGPFGYVMTVNFLNRGLLSFAFILAFAGTVAESGGSASKFRAGLALLGVWSAGAILLAIFPTDVPTTPVHLHGVIHLFVAIIAFLGGAFGALLVSLRMGLVPRLRGVSRAALILAVLSVLLCLVDLLAPSFAPGATANYGGLIERLFLGSVLAWILLVSGYALRHEADRPRQ